MTYHFERCSTHIPHRLKLGFIKGLRIFYGLDLLTLRSPNLNFEFCIMQADLPIGFADIVECEASLASLTHVQIPLHKYRSACKWARHLADDVTGRPLSKIFFFVKFSDGCFYLNLAKPRLLETVSSGGQDYIQVPKSEFEPVRRQGAVSK